MNKINLTITATLSCLAVTSFAAERGRWSFSAGPSWRSRVEMDVSGTLVAPAPVPRQTIERDMQNFDNWTENLQNDYDDPLAGVPGSMVPAGSTLWGATASRTEIYGVAGQDYRLNSSGTESPMGLNLQGCYDCLQGDTWAIGLNLRFAGYWNMKSSTRGYYNAGYTKTEKYTDTWVDENSISALRFDAGGVDPVNDAATKIGATLDSPPDMDYRGSRTVATRLRSDLYQIGLGPKIAWSPFAGRLECLEWLDVYGGVEVLCNIAHSKFEADNSSSSQTECLLGFGGNVGFVGNVTDWFGIYGQVGYEWIDKADVEAGDFNADIDYSSLVLSAGLQFRF